MWRIITSKVQGHLVYALWFGKWSSSSRCAHNIAFRIKSFTKHFSSRIHFKRIFISRCTAVASSIRTIYIRITKQFTPNFIRKRIVKVSATSWLERTYEEYCLTNVYEKTTYKAGKKGCYEKRRKKTRLADDWTAAKQRQARACLQTTAASSYHTNTLAHINPLSVFQLIIIACDDPLPQGFSYPLVTHSRAAISSSEKFTSIVRYRIRFLQHHLKEKALTI